MATLIVNVFEIQRGLYNSQCKSGLILIVTVIKGETSITVQCRTRAPAFPFPSPLEYQIKTCHTVWKTIGCVRFTLEGF